MAQRQPGRADKPPQRVFASRAGAESVIGDKPLNGYITTITHLLKGYVGTGIFVMGKGYKYSGLVFGSIILAIISLMNLHCQHILVTCSRKIAAEEGDEDLKPSFAETVEYTLERSKLACLRNNSASIGWATNIFLCCAELGFCCVYFVFISEHIEEIAVNHGWLEKDAKANAHIILGIILIPMWASTFLGNLKMLLPLSIIANILIWIGIGILLYFTLYERLPPVSERELITEASVWPLYFGIVLYAFEGITFIIPLRNEMRNPYQFVSIFGVLNVGMFIVTGLYFLVGFLSYWKWGKDVKDSVLLNISQEDLVMSDVVNCVLVVAIIFTFTLHMYIPFEITFPLFYRKYGPFKHGQLVVFIYKAVPVLITYILANVVPFLTLFVALIGASVGSFLALIFPGLLELVSDQKLSFVTKTKDIVIIFVGISGSILGTGLSLWDIITEFRKKYFSD